jgi:hypothetical protein
MSETMLAALIGGLLTLLGGVLSAFISNWHNIFPKQRGANAGTPAPNKTKKRRNPDKRLRFIPTALTLLVGVAATSLYLTRSGPAPPTSSGSVPPPTPLHSPKPLPHILLREDFDDAANRWVLVSSPERRYEIRRGGYHLRSNTGEASVSVIQVGGLSDHDFQIDARVRKLAGRDDYFFGLVWGHSDDSNFSNLAITGSGNAAVTSKRNGAFIDFANQRYFREEVNKGNSVNDLRIERRSGTMLFFVNNYRVEHEMDEQSVVESLRGHGVGFVMYNDVDLEIDYLIVSRP